MVGRIAAAMVVLGTLAACGGGGTGDRIDPDQVDAVEPPELGACRMLTLDDLQEVSDATRTVDCSDKHTAQTYAVSQFPGSLDDAKYDAPELGAVAFETCGPKFAKFLGADESLAMRSIVSWAWFRPSERAWEKGARWYRCDVVGGGEQSAELAPLPDTAEGLLQGRPDDKWIVCVAGPSVVDSLKIPCSEKHDWRAVTTIKLGEAADEYPGGRLVEAKTRDFCSDSVGAWLNYPVDFDFGYTFFEEPEWNAGNRRSVCWAKTSA